MPNIFAAQEWSCYGDSGYSTLLSVDLCINWQVSSWLMVFCLLHCVRVFEYLHIQGGACEWDNVVICTASTP